MSTEHSLWRPDSIGICRVVPFKSLADKPAICAELNALEAQVAKLTEELAACHEEISDKENELIELEEIEVRAERAEAALAEARASALEEAARRADSWSDPCAVWLAEGVLTERELHDARQVASGIAAAIRALKPAPSPEGEDEYPNRHVDKDLEYRLIDRATTARLEGTATALGDALHFEEAADKIARMRQEIAALMDKADNFERAAVRNYRLAQAAETKLCEDCPPAGYPTDRTRCVPCPRASAEQAKPQPEEH